MQKLCLVPIEVFGQYRGPKYFNWRFPQSPNPILGRWSMMDYGFLAYGLVWCDILQEDVTRLEGEADVYIFPDNLSLAVSDPNIDTFFEGINLPTDWLTPSTTYLELLRNTAGIFQFNQRYGAIYADLFGVPASIFDNATLDTRLRQLSDNEQAVFLATAESFGIDPQLINTNAQLRLLVRQASNIWEGQPFYLGGIEF